MRVFVCFLVLSCHTYVIIGKKKTDPQKQVDKQTDRQRLSDTLYSGLSCSPPLDVLRPAWISYSSGAKNYICVDISEIMMQTSTTPFLSSYSSLPFFLPFFLLSIFHSFFHSFLLLFFSLPSFLFLLSFLHSIILSFFIISFIPASFSAFHLSFFPSSHPSFNLNHSGISIFLSPCHSSCKPTIILSLYILCFCCFFLLPSLPSFLFATFPLFSFLSS